MKITPAHDPNDFEVGLRHNLPQPSCINEDATMNELAGKYAGMNRYECRKAWVTDLEAAGYLVKVEDMVIPVGECYRCKDVVEPMLSEQWFVRMEELAKSAMEAAKNGDLTHVPERFEKIYLHWLEEIKDWCISRQLWWGHRIPAYYCDDCGEIMVLREPLRLVPNAAAAISGRMKMCWTHGSALPYGHSPPWDGRSRHRIWNIISPRMCWLPVMTSYFSGL